MLIFQCTVVLWPFLSYQRLQWKASHKQSCTEEQKYSKHTPQLPVRQTGRRGSEEETSSQIKLDLRRKRSSLRCAEERELNGYSHLPFSTHTHTHTHTHTSATDSPQTGVILTYSLLANNASGFFDAWWASGGGAALPHGCCLSWLVPAPAFGEGTVHKLSLALRTYTWCRWMERGTMSQCTFKTTYLRTYVIYICDIIMILWVKIKVSCTDMMHIIFTFIISTLTFKYPNFLKFPGFWLYCYIYEHFCIFYIFTLPNVLVLQLSLWSKGQTKTL